MGDIAIHKANELPSDARRAVERVLGRVLEPDEEVSIMAFSPHDAPTGEARQKLARQLEDRISRTAESVRHVPEEEQEAALTKPSTTSARTRNEDCPRYHGKGT